MIITLEGRLWFPYSGPYYGNRPFIQQEESYQRRDAVYEWDAQGLDGWMENELEEYKGKRIRITVEVLED